MYRFESCYFQTMSVNKFLKKDFKLRLVYFLFELEYKIFKSLASNKILPLNFRLKAFNKISFFKATKIRNFCIFTGRSRGVIQKFGVSRFIFRELADNGLITGLKRAS